MLDTFEIFVFHPFLKHPPLVTISPFRRGKVLRGVEEGSIKTFSEMSFSMLANPGSWASSMSLSFLSHEPRWPPRQIVPSIKSAP